MVSREHAFCAAFTWSAANGRCGFARWWLGCSYSCGRPGRGMMGAWQRHDGGLRTRYWRFAALFVLCLGSVMFLVTIVSPRASLAGWLQLVPSPVLAHPFALQPTTADTQQSARAYSPTYALGGGCLPLQGLLVASPSPLHCLQCAL